MNSNQFSNAPDSWEQQYNQQETTVSQSFVAAYITKVYAWMCLGLALTGGIGFWVAGNDALLASIVNYRMFLFIGQIVMVGFLALRVHKMSAAVATAVFLGYAALNGLTFGLIFAIYSTKSLMAVFAITAGTFGVMTAVGYFTKTDLTSFGRIMMMGLIGIIIASVVNIFVGSSTLHWIISYVGVAVFVGLIAYDTQKIKTYAYLDNEEDRKRGAILGALALYLDFINLFIYLLRLFGSSRN